MRWQLSVLVIYIIVSTNILHHFYIHIGKCVLWSILFCLIFEILASLIYIIDILNNPIYLWYYYIVYIPRTALMFNVLVLGIFLLYDVMRLMKII